jgi:hypothetical protein
MEEQLHPPMDLEASFALTKVEPTSSEEADYRA